MVTGSIENSRSLNRYAYCQRNPVNYLDPFGLSPQSFGSWAGHTVLNVLGFIPVFEGVADAVNTVWYLCEGNYAEAIACAVGAIPLIGNLATGFKIGSNVVKGCNILANVGKASIGFYNGVQNVMNIDSMIRSGTGRWYDYVGQGVLFGLNMLVSALGVSGAWSGISNLVNELNYKKMQGIAKDVSVRDIDGGPELTELLEQESRKANRVGTNSHFTELVPYYPPNNGVIKGPEKKIYLMAGDKIDRFGGIKGKYFSPVVTPMEMRALPYDADLSQYRQFEVEASTIAPAFGKIGLGTQYRVSVSVEILLKEGIIKQIGGN